ncbi:hypothetical protein H072_4293 [Dactylellina haptotyla CBS 200.50]|uniref:DUF4360 domain-containing protein n=1 Tax=Dactylellina haptotyla (strain CBS 200.50) TaxID=1284197 RepID=S8BQR9_DACHA|nr:hypothetical protein H072_4293 [Dactylellina haptotyla CBS 200.50]
MRPTYLVAAFFAAIVCASPAWPAAVTTTKKVTTTTTKSTTTKSTTKATTTTTTKATTPTTTTTTTTPSTTKSTTTTTPSTTKSTTTTTTTTTTTPSTTKSTTTSSKTTTTTSSKPSYTIPPGVDLSEIYVNGITYGGTGCPQGSVGTYISSDRKTFTLIFDNYVAAIGAGVSITDSRKNCQLNIDIHYPQGFQYSIFTMDYRGYAYLETGVTATQSATYYFSGYSDQISKSSSLVGPKDENYLIHDEIASTSVVWSPCGEAGALNINSQISLKSSVSSSSGLMTTDSEDGKFTYVLGLQWAQCP